MPIFGRPSAREDQRAQRIAEWTRARTPYALPALLFGILGVLDAFLLLGLVLGPAAIILGQLGRRDINARPHLLGSKLCITAIVLGVLGFALSVSMLIYYKL